MLPIVSKAGFVPGETVGFVRPHGVSRVRVQQQQMLLGYFLCPSPVVTTEDWTGAPFERPVRWAWVLRWSQYYFERDADLGQWEQVITAQEADYFRVYRRRVPGTQ